MYLSILIAAFVLLVFLVFKRSSIVFLKLRDLWMPLLCTLFILCLLLFSDTAVASASKGVYLWLNVVFPSLFPFFVASDMLRNTGFIKALGILLEPIMRPLFNVPGVGSFAFAMGITSGYPMGAIITSSMREEKLLSKPEAERLLAFTNNSGPLFIVGAVAVGMFKAPELGMLLLTSHILACFTIGILFRFYKKDQQTATIRTGHTFKRFRQELFHSQKGKPANVGSLLGNAVKNSVTTLLMIGGFIVVFSVLINILLELGIISKLSSILYLLASPLGIHQDIVKAFVSGLFEITTGTNMAASATGISLIQKLMAASMIIGWAGLSVHSQVISVVSKTDISVKPYLIGKFAQGVFAALYTLVLYKLLGSSLLKSAPVFLPSKAFTQDFQWHDYFFYSCKSVLVILGVLSALTFIFFLRRLFSWKITSLSE